MSLLLRFTDHIQNEHLFQKKDHLLLAVSGGVDSIVLCELCHRAGFFFNIAHCNFQLRGVESDLDEKLVESLGIKYGIQVLIKKFETEEYAKEHKCSIQVAARELRYQWFNELLDNDSALSYQLPGTGKQLSNTSYLLTAHHANDNIETLLMNFFKGTGIQGLGGIPSKQAKILRPLLFARKEELLSFANENNLAFREDASNESDKYTRNYFRNQLIPAVQKVFPNVEENLINNIQRFKDINKLYRQALQIHTKKLIEFKGNEIHIPVLKLLNSDPLRTIIYEIIKEHGFTTLQTDEVLHLLKSETGKFILSPSHKIIKNRNWIIISPNNTTNVSLILINRNDKEIDFENGTLFFRETSFDKYKQRDDNSIVTVDADLLRFPLLLRRWKQGDYFYPLGLKKASGTPAKKKLSRFFTDQKMSLTEKEKCWVIESDKKIIWIVGKRIDDRFKVKDHTENLFTIRFKEQ